MIFDYTPDEPKPSAELMAAALNGNAIELVKTEHGFQIPESSPTDQADVGRLKKLLATYRESAAAIVDSDLFTPAHIAAGAMLGSAPGVHNYMAGVRWAVETPVRATELMPPEAMLRAVMFPLVHAAMLHFLGEGEFGMTIDGETANIAVSDLVSKGLLLAGHAPTMSLIEANLDAVRINFYALLFADEGEPAVFDDPDLPPGYEKHAESDFLTDGEYLMF